MTTAFRDDLLAQSAIAGAAGGVAGKASVFSGASTFVVNSYYRRKQHELEERRFKLDEELKRMAEERKLMETRARIEALGKCSSSSMAPLVDTHF